jgi:hypothetical protein
MYHFIGTPTEFDTGMLDPYSRGGENCSQKLNHCETAFRAHPDEKRPSR